MLIAFRSPHLPNEMGSCCCAKGMWIWRDLVLFDIIGHIIGGAFGSTVLLLLLFVATLRFGHWRDFVFLLLLLRLLDNNVSLQWVMAISCHGQKGRLVKKKGETTLCVCMTNKCVHNGQKKATLQIPFSALYSHTCHHAMNL